MQIGVIEVPTRKALLVQKIEEQILSGQLRVGDSLPSERQLQEETHISKTMIHAALVELEQKGFLEITPRRGAVVANYAESGTMFSATVSPTASTLPSARVVIASNCVKSSPAILSAQSFFWLSSNLTA